VKTYDPDLLAHFQQSGTTVARCILIRRSFDHVDFGFTTHDRPLFFEDVWYQPTASFIQKDIAANLNLDTDNTEAEALLDSDTLTEEDLRAGKWDFSPYRIFQVNWADLSMGSKKDSIGHLAKVTVNRQTFVAELLGLMEALGTSIGEITTPNCRAMLGDERCKVDLTPYTFYGTVTSADPDMYTFVDTSMGQPDTYFAEGIVRFQTGIMEHLSYDIKSFTAGGTFITKTPMAYDPTGCDYVAVVGCDKKRTTCRDKFSNVINFRGEPWLRGNDVLIQIGRSE
jgi:uncharacterized phage protein (TIGR02218 family)